MREVWLMNIAPLLKGVLPWEVWIEEHPTEMLNILIGIVLLMTIILL